MLIFYEYFNIICKRSRNMIYVKKNNRKYFFNFGVVIIFSDFFNYRFI